jgi:hypothetical protein
MFDRGLTVVIYVITVGGATRNAGSVLHDKGVLHAMSPL